MHEQREQLFYVDRIFYSEKLKRLTSQFSDSALMVLKPDGRSLGLVSLSTEQIDASLQVFPFFTNKDPGAPFRISRYRLNEADIQMLESIFKRSRTSNGSGEWTAVSCTFPDGTCEGLALKLAPGQDVDAIEPFLEKIWRVLREDCLNEVRDLEMTVGDDALLWMASDRIDVAILVLDENCRIIKSNSAAKEVLGAGKVLSRMGANVIASTPAETRKLREALHLCAHAQTAEQSEEILCLNDRSRRARVPVSLSRYHHMGQPTDLVVAMLPMPPNPERIELLGRKLGLTPAEARVAVLMQSGLTNREAADRAGLKEQTFNTYAKRVLGKLNVAGRTEMAQLLTWQAAGRRMA